MPKSGYLYFNGTNLMDFARDNGRVGTIKDLEHRTGISYPTCLLYTNPGFQLQTTALSRIYDLLTNGMGFTPAELSRMSLTDIFAIVPPRQDGELPAPIVGDWLTLAERIQGNE